MKDENEGMKNIFSLDGKVTFGGFSLTRNLVFYVPGIKFSTNNLLLQNM